MNAGENQIVVYQPNETVRLDVRAEIIPGLLASIRKATAESVAYPTDKSAASRSRRSGRMENR